MFTPIAYYNTITLGVYDNLFRGSWDASNSSSYPGSGTTWYNVSGSSDFEKSNVNYPAWVDSGSADYFDGSNSAYFSSSAFLMDSASSPSGTYGNGLTFSLWVYPTSFTQIGWLWLQSGDGYDIGIFGGNSRFNFSVYSSVSDTQYGNGTSVGAQSANQWYNVVLTFDGVNFKGYVNNSLITTFAPGTPTSMRFANTADNLYLGYLDKSATSYYMNGQRLSMFEMWNRPLPSSQVTEIWDYHKSRFGY